MIHSASPRKGLSLIEVILAVSILLGSVTVLGSILTDSIQRAQVVEERNLALQLAQSKMAEISAGIISPDGVGDSQFDPSEAPEGWEYSVDVTDADYAGLWNVTVSVRFLYSRYQPPRDYILSKMVIDPQVRGTTLDEAIILGEDNPDETEEQPMP